MTNRFTDLAISRGDDGIYDFEIENGDLKKVNGLESAIGVSIFTDRRANIDEVLDPMRQRGWCGTQNTANQEGNKGSGVWLYEQDDMTPAIVEGIRMEVFQSLAWMLTDRIASQINVNASPVPEKRQLIIDIEIFAIGGGVIRHSFQLWNNTKSGTLKK